MSSPIGVEHTLELLNRLRGAVQDFAAREAALAHDLRVKLSRTRQSHEEKWAEELGRLEAALADAEASFLTARNSEDSRYERRKANISRARSSSKLQTLDRIEARTGARKYELQKKLMQAERDRDAALAAAAANFEEFKNNPAEGDELAALEKSARSAFRGYGSFSRALSRESEPRPAEAIPEAGRVIGELRELLKQGRAELDRFRSVAPPKVSRFFGIGKSDASPAADRVIAALGKARRLYDLSCQMSDEWYQQEIERINLGFTEATATIDQDLKLAMKDNVHMKGSFRETIDDKTVRITSKNEKIHLARLQHLDRDHAANVKRLQQEIESHKTKSAHDATEMEADVNEEHQAQWQTLESEWQTTLVPIYDAIKAADAQAEALFPPWSQELLDNWKPPAKFAQVAKFARIDADVQAMCESLPKDPRLALPGPAKFSVPLCLTYPREGSVLFEMANSSREVMIGALNNIILRLLATAPPGRLNFTIIDPVGLGQNFAGVMHLADFEAQLINSRIWTQAAQIEQKLADLNEHMEKVIQMYLRNEYETIAEYNEQAGNIAEKYHFLVVADFPVNFSDAAVKRLLSIAASGARCGVYSLIHWDQRQPVPPDFLPRDLRKSCVSITARGNELSFIGKVLPGTELSLEPPPQPELAIQFVQKLGQASRDSSRVEVPFEHVTPPESEIWTMDTTSELRVPIGRTGATKLQYLAIGKGTRQHALVAGKTGSGKSTLFHVIITNLSLWCSPEQVEFYLVDFKKGVEFKCYASRKLPHARVIAIESDREFGLSVLQRVDDELKRRGDLFRKLGAQDLGGYKRAGGTEAIPRSLLLIDEFQEFFVEDDKVSQTASVLLDRIVRQGRAFGIHVVLGSQTLGGAYTLARTTIGQMVIRVALQCNEADAYLIMDEDNPAPRLLSRPGEGIYNDAAGRVEGNSPFQVVWLPDEVRDSYLEKVRNRADQSKVPYPAPVVFEGNAPADVRENELLPKLLEEEPAKPPVAARIWLGAPNSIKGPTEVVFHRQSGNHLLVVGQREEATLAMLSVGLVALAAEYPKGAARFVVFDGNPPGTAPREYFERVAKSVPHEVTIAKAGDVAEIMNRLAEDLKKRSEDTGAEAPATFIFIHGLQKFSKLRHEEDFSFSAEPGAPSPAAQLAQLIADGASHGIHVIATCDSFNNVGRFLSRKSLGEFEMRVLFQMSVNDSASLIDNPKASMLGLHRALFYNGQEGHLETFRPYALPDDAWVGEMGKKLK